MGCAASKGAAVASPAYEVTTSSSAASSYSVSRSASTGAAVEVASIWSRPVRLDAYEDDGDGKKKASAAAAAARGGVECSSVVGGGGVRLGNIHRYVEAEQVAAGWPSWLSAAAAEAVHGWVPLKAANFEKLDKIGQGTYSSVFRARNLETGKMVALKKVRFDSGEPESVRFMAREILILRRLHRHPNVVSLDGLITSSSSPNLYLVFDYSHHDLAGLSSDPSLSFSLPEIKCYMRQLLLGLEHCHARGVMHRDIKCANLLVSDGGELKVADFGLANVFDASAARSAAMTSRVVTLWYRPPELLLGATAYDASVDLWSAGCVFAEMHARRPILQGRTEVEQIHRIFKLCGSPGDGYWRRAAAGGGGGAGFRPQQPYESRLRETFGDMMPDDAFGLLSTLLSVEPSARGTATEALASEYFRTEPYACEPSSLPKYAPNKEMDAKLREDSRKRGNVGRNHGGGEATKRLSRGHKSMQDTAAAAAAAVASQRHGHGHGHVHAEESLPRANGGAAGEARLFVDLQPVPVIASKRHDDPPPPPPLSRSFQDDDDAPPRLADRLPLSGPVQLTGSTGFAWAKKPRPDSTTTTTTTTKRCSSKVPRTNSNGAVHAAGAYEAEKQEAIKQWAQVANAFTSSESYNNRFREPTMATAAAATKQLKSSKKHKVGGGGGGGRMHRVGFSGPLLSQPRRIDELLENHEQQIRRAGRRSWFRKGSKKEQQ